MVVFLFAAIATSRRCNCCVATLQNNLQYAVDLLYLVSLKFLFGYWDIQ